MATEAYRGFDAAGAENSISDAAIEFRWHKLRAPH